MKGAAPGSCLIGAAMLSALSLDLECARTDRVVSNREQFVRCHYDERDGEICNVWLLFINLKVRSFSRERI